MNQNENMGVEITLTEENESSATTYDLSPEDFAALIANATALRLEVDETLEADTCLSCPDRTDHWFKLTVLQTADYNFAANACACAQLYDATGNPLTSDNLDGEKNNFCINYLLRANKVYYLRIMPKYNHFIRFNTTIVGTFTFVESINISPDTISLILNQTVTLAATVFPESSTIKSVFWESSNPEIVTVIPGKGKVTAVSPGTATIYAKSTDGSKKEATCTVTVLNLKEDVEYHLLCNNDLAKALRVGRKNVLSISESLFVRGERRSYWNRQKWVLKGVGNGKKLYTQLNQSCYLCNNIQNDINEVYVSNSATDANSHLTIISYGDEGLCEIKLTNSDLFLTLVECERHGSLAYWGEWKAYDTVNHHLQVWKFVEQPASHCWGVDTDHQIDNATANILKLNNKGFVARYYANKENISPNYQFKILTATEVIAIHNKGLKIVSIYEDGGKDFSVERGRSDASEALRLATMLGQPSGSAIYFAVEPDYSDQISSIKDYFKAVYETFGNDGKYKVGVYGRAKVCKTIKDDLGYADFSWLGQSNYASNSSIEGEEDYIFYDSEEKYDIKQSEPVSYNGIDFDSDTSIRSDYGQW